jgi:ribosomal-protein-serine acetyltransferase
MPRRRGLRPRLLAAVVRSNAILAFAAERRVVRRIKEGDMIALPIGRQADLRPIRQEDATELFSLIEANRPYLREWLTWLDGMTSVSAAESYIASRATLAAEGKAFCFVIRVGDRTVGLSHLVEYQRHRQESLDWLLGWS